MRGRSFAAAAWLGILFQVGSPPTALGQADLRTQRVPESLTISFEGGQAAANYAEVMAALGQAKLLPLTAYVDRAGMEPSAILAINGLLAGAFVAQPLEMYLCDENRHVCTVPQEWAKRPVWTNVKAPDNVDETQISCTEPERPAFALCIPDFRVFRYRTSTVISYDARKERLKDILLLKTGGCAAIDDRCRKLIDDLNPQLKPGEAFSPKFAGKLRVPVESYRVTLPVASTRHLSRLTGVLDETIAKLEKQGGPGSQQRHIYYTVPFSPAPQGTHWGLGEGEHWRKVLQDMGYDFATKPLAPVTVGIWDQQVDKSHCNFGPDNDRAVVHFEPLDPNGADPPRPPKAAACGTLRQPLYAKWDHATHLAGIIAARPHQDGVTGANPRVLLWAYEITGQSLERDDPFIRFSDKTAGTKIGRPLVVNISQQADVEQYQTALEAVIKKNSDRVLFVTAAGNADKEISDLTQCKISPACLSANKEIGDGVISVVALDSGGADLLREGSKSSNRGPVFDVAAIGKVVSTLYGDAVGVMPGTSVAAPYVTGLASLIYANAGNLTPKQVKQRILYTADFTDWLDELVGFGRINFGRALRLSNDAIKLKPDFCVSPCPLWTRPLKKTITEKVTVLEAMLGDQPQRNLTLEVSRIRRIAAQSQQPDSRYWVVYVDDSGALRKLASALFAPNQTLRFKDGLQPRAVSLTEVEDYTCAFFCR